MNLTSTKTYLNKRAEIAAEENQRVTKLKNTERAKQLVNEHKTQLLEPFVEIFGNDFVDENLVLDTSILNYHNHAGIADLMTLEVGVRPKNLPEGKGVIKVTMMLHYCEEITHDFNERTQRMETKRDYAWNANQAEWQTPGKTSVTEHHHRVKALTAYWDKLTK